VGVLEGAVLAVLLRLPVCYVDRGDPRKPEQLSTVARAISTVANGSEDKASKLISVAYNETRLCLHVHSGAHRGPGRGLWQLEGQGRRYKGPFVGLDYDSTLNAARVASNVLDHSYQCGRTPRDVFTAYGARPCVSNWKTLDARVRTYQWAYWRLSRG
jgi:hypothetical protein